MRTQEVDFPSNLGQSGSMLFVEWVDGQKLVRKSASGANRERLLLQAQLQEDYYKRCHGDAISAPEIVHVTDSGFSMRYVDGIPLGEWLLVASLKAAEEVRDRLLDWLRSNLRQSQYADHKAELLTKLGALKELDWSSSELLCRPEDLFEHLERVFSTYASRSVEGFTHGDLSFDNILVEHFSGRLYLIDFLDAPAASPLFDLARIYLDARFAWWASHGRPRNRLLLASRKLTTGIEQLLHEQNIAVTYFESLLVLNILRILPYTKSPVRRGLLLDALHRGAPFVLNTGF